MGLFNTSLAQTFSAQDAQATVFNLFEDIPARILCTIRVLSTWKIRCGQLLVISSKVVESPFKLNRLLRRTSSYLTEKA